MIAKPDDGIAWVTGATSGIGRAVALKLAARGWRVLATARREADLESLSAKAAATGGTIIGAAADITDREGIAALIANAEAAHGPIALAFLNAGTYFGDKEDSFSADPVWKTFEINVGGTVNCIAPLSAAMMARKRGQIVINASVAGYGGLPRSFGYGPTKAALINMAESMRLTLEAKGLLVQIVCPGFVRTPLTDKNRFPMPFLVDVDQAATRICDGMQSSSFEITFPRRLSWILKALNHLPYPLYFALVRKVTGG